MATRKLINVEDILDFINTLSNDDIDYFIESDQPCFLMRDITSIEIGYDGNNKETPYMLYIASNESSGFIHHHDLDLLFNSTKQLTNWLNDKYNIRFIYSYIDLDHEVASKNANVMTIYAFHLVSMCNIVSVCQVVDFTRTLTDFINFDGSRSNGHAVTDSSTRTLDACLEAISEHTVMVRIPNPIYNTPNQDQIQIAEDHGKGYYFKPIKKPEESPIKHIFMNLHTLKSVRIIDEGMYKEYYELRIDFTNTDNSYDIYFKTKAERSKYLREFIKCLPDEYLEQHFIYITDKLFVRKDNVTQFTYNPEHYCISMGEVYQQIPISDLDEALSYDAIVKRCLFG